MTMPEISVIVPVYNVAPYLAACLDSILAQTFRDFELILIDDGSTDGSRDIEEAYAAKDARVRLMKRRWNRGAARAYTFGLEVAQGKYVAFVDNDDIVTPQYLAVLHQAAEEREADVVQAGFQEFRQQPGDGRGYRWTKKAGLLQGGLQQRVDCFVPVRMHIAPWSKLFRRAFLDAHHLTFCDVPVAPDVSFHFECLITARRYVLLPDILYHYRLRSESIDHAEGLVRAERYAVATARMMEHVTAWLQQEPAFRGERLQRQIRNVLYTFCRNQLRHLVRDCGREDVYDACHRALQGEPQDALRDAMFYAQLQK